MEWEVLELRKTLPADLQTVLGFPVCIVRVPRNNDDKMRAKHPRDLQQYADLDLHLLNWEAAGPDPEKVDRWNVFFRDEGVWFLLVIGRSRAGSYNFVTVYSSDNVNYVPNRMARGNYTRRERK